MIFQRRQKALWSKGLKRCHIMMKIKELRYLPERGHISKEEASLSVSGAGRGAGGVGGGSHLFIPLL